MEIKRNRMTLSSRTNAMFRLAIWIVFIGLSSIVGWLFAILVVALVEGKQPDISLIPIWPMVFLVIVCEVFGLAVFKIGNR